MSARTLPSVEELTRRAAARVERLRPIVEGGASLLALEVSGIQRFIFDVPTNNAGLEVKARSFLVALLPKVLAWRARRAADLDPDHEVLVAAGRAFLLVPSAHVDAVSAALRRDAQMLREHTGDDLAVDVAVHPIVAGALDATGEGSFSEVQEIVTAALTRAKLRRAEGEPQGFWAPRDPPPSRPTDKETPFAELGRKLRVADHRISAVGIASSAAAGGAAWSHLPEIAVAVGPSLGHVAEQLVGPVRLLLRTDGGPPPPQGEAGDEIAALPLAGTWIAADGAGTLDFEGLARRAEGDAKLGVLRLDLDALGPTFRAVAEGKCGGDALRDRLALSDAVSFACGPLADGVTWSGDSPRPVQWILAGGDDLFLVGAWSEILDLSLGLRKAIVPPLGEVVRSLAGSAAAEKVDISGGLVLADPRVPLAHLADQAEAEVHWAKGERTTSKGPRAKGAMAWGGIAVGWEDWAIVVELGQKLGVAIKDGKMPRTILRRLLGIHTLWSRATRALAEDRGSDAAEAAKRQWLWAYHLGRTQAGLDEERTQLARRLVKLALENKDEGAVNGTEQEAAAWLGIIAEIAHRRTRGRAEE